MLLMLLIASILVQHLVSLVVNMIVCLSDDDSMSWQHFRGGHHAYVVHYQELEDFIVDGPAVLNDKSMGLVYKGVYSDIEVLQFPASTYVHVKADVTSILPLLTASQCV